MKSIPIVRVTELLATAYGIFVSEVVTERAAGASEFALATYRVRDVQGRAWRLSASGAAMAAATGHTAGTVCRWGLQWRVRREACSRQESPPAPMCLASSVSNRESGVLERVGSWLHQPAGLPPAFDIPGQAFVTLWHTHRPEIAALHSRAEARHDALCCALRPAFSGDRHTDVAVPIQSDGALHLRDWDVLLLPPTPQGALGVDAAPEASGAQRVAWTDDGCVLRALVDAASHLLGGTALAYSRAARRHALRQVRAVLETLPATPRCAPSRAQGG